MKKNISAALVFAALATSQVVASPDVAAAATVRGNSSIVLDAATGAVISQNNPDMQLYPASLTKMMTTYLLFEALERGDLKMGDQIRISDNATRQEPSKIGLKAGQTLSVEDSIQAIVTRSANDIAVAVGERLGGSEQAFAVKMTNKARAIGMTRTTFKNASGLPNAAQVSTARDMSTLARRLILDFPQYYHYFGEKNAVVAGKPITSHNRLMQRYDGMDGLKTGYIDASGFNLVSSASRGGVRLIGVVFGGKTAKSRDDFMAKLMDGGFASYGLLNAKGDPKGVVSASLMTVPRPPRSKPYGDDTQQAALPEVTLNSLTESETREQPTAAALNARALLGEPIGETIMNSRSNTLQPPNPQPTMQPMGFSQTIQPQLAPALAPAPAATPSREWAVQIGAYRDEAGAMVAATDLLHQMPKLAGMGEPKVSLVESPVGKLYRSQIVALEQTTSQAVCAELAKQRRNCLVLAPGQ